MMSSTFQASNLSDIKGPSLPNAELFIDRERASKALEEAITGNIISVQKLIIESLPHIEGAWMLKASFQAPTFKFGPVKFGHTDCVVYLEGNSAAQVDQESGIAWTTNQPVSGGQNLYTLWKVPDCVYLRNGTDLTKVLEWFIRCK